MPESTPAEAVQEQQRKDASRLMERLSQVSVPDLTVSYTLERSATVLPGLLVRFIVVAVLFRLNSAKKWRLALEQELLPEDVQRWLGIGELAELIKKATVDWIPPQVFMDTVSWQVIECLTRCGVPQPIAVVRQTIRWLLLRGSKVSQNGIVLDRRFWRTFVARSTRPCSAEVAEECRERIELVLGQVDLSEEIERRWLDVPELSASQPVHDRQGLENAVRQRLSGGSGDPRRAHERRSRAYPRSHGPASGDERGDCEQPDESPARSLREVERPCAGSRPGRPGRRDDQYPQVAQDHPRTP